MKQKNFGAKDKLITKNNDSSISEIFIFSCNEKINELNLYSSFKDKGKC